MAAIDGTDSAILSRESADFVRLRTARFGLIAAIVGGAFWIARALSTLTSSGAPALGSSSMLTHLGGVIASLLLWWIARGTSSARVARNAELVLVVVACSAYSALVVGLPEAYRADAQAAQAMGILLLGRAVYVPSSRRRTAILGAAMAIPILGAALFTHAEIHPAFRAAFHAVQERPESDRTLRWNIVGSQVVFWIATVAIASWVSGVIYGLRRRVREAEQLGQYRIEAKIGEGGMGVVYRARHALLRRPTAIKLLHPDRVGEASLARFAREVRATANLAHPNTVTIYDYGRTPDGTFYYAMELLDGATLRDVVRADGPQPASRVLHVLHQVAGALAEAHAAQLLHRDIKPDNVLLTRMGGQVDVAKVVDFGLVKELGERAERGEPASQKHAGDPELTRDNVLVGTPLYLSPEAIRGEVLDARSDLYALGAVAYFLLTGEHVFTGSSVVEVCKKHLEHAPERPSDRLGRELPPDVEQLVLSCLAKDPALRPADALALRAAIEACACFGDWTHVRAERWWRDFGNELPHLPKLGADGKSALRVDLTRRDASTTR